MRIYSFWKAARLMRSRVAPPSIRTWYSLMLAMVGETTSRSCLTPAMFFWVVRGVERDRCLHPLVVGHRSRRGCSCCHCSTQHLDDTPGHDVSGATVYDVQLLATLVGTGAQVRVGVVVDSLERHLGVLELHLLLPVALGEHLLLAFLLAGRHAVTARLLLLLLMKLFHEILDLSALLDVVVPRVVHRALRTSLLGAEELLRSLVASSATAHTSHCSRCSGSGCSNERHVVAAGLLLRFVSVFCGCSE
jgi:hypothetical protein